MHIVTARDQAQIKTIKFLFRAYADALGIDLSFQHFATELANLPGDYAPPYGQLLLAMDGDTVLGCVALRPLKDNAAELKRLYVVPEARKQGVGKELVKVMVDWAREADYAFIRLDTLRSMTAAQTLYRQLGFYDIDAYCFNPLAGARYMELAL